MKRRKGDDSSYRTRKRQIKHLSGIKYHLLHMNQRNYASKSTIGVPISSEDNNQANFSSIVTLVLTTQSGLAARTGFFDLLRVSEGILSQLTSRMQEAVITM